jgi:hypothetical protein
MSNLILETRQAGDGRTLATINGKLYTMLAGYEDTRVDGWFFLAVAGRTPLKADDLAEHWRVLKQGNLYLALSERLFSYHLAQGEDMEPPAGCDWPRLKSQPNYYAFVGPIDNAVETQILLALEQYAPHLDPQTVLDRAVHVEDTAGKAPDALLIRI